MTLELLELQPDQAGYTYDSGNAVVSVLLEGGFSRSRLDQVNYASTVRANWSLSQQEYQYIRAFFNFYTRNGSIPFLLGLILDQPELSIRECKFVENSFTLDGNEGYVYFVSADIEVLEKKDDTFDELVLIFHQLGNEDDWFNALERLVNYDIPEIPGE